MNPSRAEVIVVAYDGFRYADEGVSRRRENRECIDVIMADSSSSNKPHDNATEHESADIHDPQESAQLAEVHHDFTASGPTAVFLAILSVIILYVTALIAFGAYALVSGHIAISNVVFSSSALILSLVPVAAFWYFRSITRGLPSNKPPTRWRRTLARISDAALGFAGRPIVRIVGLILNCCSLGTDLIYVYPSLPRIALLLMFFAAGSTGLSVVVEAKRKLLQIIDEHTTILEKHLTILDGHLEILKVHRKVLATEHVKLLSEEDSAKPASRE